MARSFSHRMREMLMSSRFFDMYSQEDQIAEMPGVHRWTEDSPVRFEIMKEGIKRGSGGPGGSRSMRIMGPTMLGMRKSLRSLGKNPSQPKTEAPADLIADLEAYLLGLGASSVGYTQVPERWIFQNKAILHTNAIVMTMEMDKPRIDTAPSQDGLEAVLEIYRDLGRIANKGADYLAPAWLFGPRRPSAHGPGPLSAPGADGRAGLDGRQRADHHPGARPAGAPGGDIHQHREPALQHPE